MLHKYKLNKRDYLSLYPLAIPERIVRDFGEDRCVTPRMIRNYYNEEKLESTRKARKRLVNAIVNGAVVFGDWERGTIAIDFEEAEERVEEEYKEAKARIMQDIQLYEARNVCN